MPLPRPWLAAIALWSMACGSTQPAPTATTVEVPVVAVSASGAPAAAAPVTTRERNGKRALFTSGASHTCLLDGGVAHCWGFNGYGQLGVGSRADAITPVRLPFDDIEALDVGGVSTCLIRRGGELSCAGEHEVFGADEHATERGWFAPVPGFGRVRRVGVSVSAICAEETDGAVRCTGSDDWVLPPVAGRPQPIEHVLHPKALRVEPYYACALVDAEVRCWGDAWMGLVPGTSPPVGFAASRAAASVREVRGALQIAMGDHHVCARMPAGSVWCWGSNSKGKLGRTTASAADFVPAEAGAITDAVDLTAGAYHTCVIGRAGDVRCWGDDGTGHGEALRAVPMPDGERAIMVRAGLMHTCALLASGDVACWGSNALAQCGSDGGGNLSEPRRVAIPPR